MRGRVLNVSVQKVDKKGNVYRTIEAVVKIPCYDIKLALGLKDGTFYDFELLQKHEFVHLTGARESRWMAGPERVNLVEVDRVD